MFGLGTEMERQNIIYKDVKISGEVIAKKWKNKKSDRSLHL